MAVKQNTKTKDVSTEVKKKASITDFIEGASNLKKKWSEFTEAEQKSFSPFMFNLWLSMNPDLIDIVNIFQKYTVGQLSPKHVYELYLGLLPKKYVFGRYIKGRKEDKYNPDLLKYLKLYYSTGESQIKEYLDILSQTPEGLSHIIEILQKYGNDDKKIKKMIRDFMD